MSNVNLLESYVGKILKKAGFNPQLRIHLGGYEIDVYVEYKSVRIAFECKQYQRSRLTVRNLIHEWSGKQEELGVEKVVLVLVGMNVSETDYELAERKGIAIWRGSKVETLLDGVIDGASNTRERILLDLGLDGEEMEARTEEVMESHNILRSTAIEYLQGGITKSKLKGLSKVRESLRHECKGVIDVLSEGDIRKFENDDTYYGEPFRDVVEKMAELGIQDKKVARLFVGGKGGTAHGEHYSGRSIRKIEMILKGFGYKFSTAKSFVSRVQPKMGALRRAVKVRSERPTLHLREISLPRRRLHGPGNTNGGRGAWGRRRAKSTERGGLRTERPICSRGRLRYREEGL